MTAGNPAVAPSGRAGARAPDLARMVALVCAAAAVYAGTFSYPLVGDDSVILETMRVPPGQSALRHLLTVPLLPNTQYHRPLIVLSLKIDQTLAGAFPWVFHLTNVLLHGLVSALVYALVVACNGSRAAALTAGLLFAATPLHVQSVAFVSGRTDVLTALFVLAAVLLWRSGRAAPKPAAASVAGFAACALLAMLAKETAVMLPLVIVPWQLIEQDRPRSARRALKSAIPWLAAWGLCLGAVLALRLLAAGIGFPNTERLGPSLLARVWIAYGRLLVLPWPLRDYYTAHNLPASAGDVLLALALPAAFAGAFFLKKSREGLRALAWFAAFMLPVLGPQHPEGAMIATRFTYLPSVGLALLCAAYVDLIPARRRARQALAVVVLAAGAVMTLGVYRASRVYSSRLALYETLYRDAPDRADFACSLADHYHTAGRTAEAVALYRRTLELDPGHRGAQLNLGRTLVSRGDYPEAEKVFQRLRQLSPDEYRVYGNLGHLRAQLGLWAESETYFRKAAELNPADATAHFNLGLSLEKLGRGAEAIVQLRRALELQPDLTGARTHLRSLEGAAGGASTR